MKTQTKTIYALITEECNLSCPHCDIRKIKNDNFNHDLFMNELLNTKGKIIFFGGEPTLYQDRLINIATDKRLENNPKTISTNLIILNEELIKLYHYLDSISTSWNPHRFSNKQYDQWLTNLQWLYDENIYPLVLITLTEDLINIPANEFLNFISSWKCIKRIRFENYVGRETNPEFFDKVDNWLCDIYKLWNVPIENEITKILGRWYYDCSNIYSLYPNGKLRNGCPQHTYPSMPNECYTCDMAFKCKPCQLQKYCSFPKKLYNIVKEKEEI